MSKNHQIPGSISHKKLNALIKKAKKERNSSTNIDSPDLKSTEDFQHVLLKWDAASKEVLNKLKKPEHNVSSNKDQKSLMALGAMEVHIHMAIQALKAYKTET